MFGRIGRRLGAAAVLFVHLQVGSAQSQSREDWLTCTSPREISADERIASCTAVLGSKNSSLNANSAYGKRAEAYLEKGDFDSAILDI